MHTKHPETVPAPVAMDLDHNSHPNRRLGPGLRFLAHAGLAAAMGLGISACGDSDTPPASQTTQSQHAPGPTSHTPSTHDVRLAAQKELDRIALRYRGNLSDSDDTHKSPAEYIPEPPTRTTLVLTAQLKEIPEAQEAAKNYHGPGTLKIGGPLSMYPNLAGCLESSEASDTQCTQTLLPSGGIPMQLGGQDDVNNDITILSNSLYPEAPCTDGAIIDVFARQDAIAAGVPGGDIISTGMNVIGAVACENGEWSIYDHDPVIKSYVLHPLPS